MSKNHCAFLQPSFLLILLLFGCAPSNNTDNIQSLVLPNNCESACWMGIKPETSTTDDVMKILEIAYGSENITSEYSDSGTMFIRWNTNNPDWQSRGSVPIINDLAESIWVTLPENKLVVKNILSGIGIPDLVGLEFKENMKCRRFSLLYPSAGLRIYLLPLENSAGISETQAVTDIYIQSPWIDDVLFPWGDTVTTPWSGYHEYCPKEWS